MPITFALCAKLAYISIMSTKTYRIVARVTGEQKEFFERAAALQGRSVSDFMIGAVSDAAQKALRDHEIVLSARDTEVLVKALLDPPPINARMRDTLRLYRERKQGSYRERKRTKVG
jgi:uncharacterized protein (DUF1778 family)